MYFEGLDVKIAHLTAWNCPYCLIQYSFEVPLYISRCNRFEFSIFFLSLKVFLYILANSVDTDGMLHARSLEY